MADQKVRAVLTEYGAPLMSTYSTQDGVALEEDDLVLVVNAVLQQDNGIYFVRGSSLWEKLNDVYIPGMEVRVLEGVTYGMSLWVLDVAEPPIAGVTALPFFCESVGKAIQTGVNVNVDNANGTISLPSIMTAGTYQNPILDITATGTIRNAYSASIVSGYIEGLKYSIPTFDSYGNNTDIVVEPGAAWIPGLNKIVELKTNWTYNTGDSLWDSMIYNSTFVYLYLYEINGVGNVEVSPIAPAAPYFGSARTKSYDDTRRYIGTLCINIGEPQPVNTVVMGGSTVWVQYVEQTLQDHNASMHLYLVYDASNTSLSAASVNGVLPASSSMMVIGGYVDTTTAATGLVKFGWAPGTTSETQYRVRVPSPNGYLHGYNVAVGTNRLFYFATGTTNVVADFWTEGYYDRR